MTEAARQAKEEELASLQRQLQLYEKDATLQLQKRQQEKMQPLLDKLQNTINEVSKEKNVEFTLIQGVANNPILLYVKDERKNNITLDVLKKLGVEVNEEEFYSTGKNVSTKSSK